MIGVAQTWISNQVGQRVMHDLRAAVYAHLQRMSLAFFTRTRTGEVQSRIANDIGGIDSVVTSTATSIVQNVTTVVATVVAMFLLDWRLAVFSLILLPFFVWLTRRVGEERRRIQSVRQSRLADMSSLVEESLSVSGILLGKTMGRSPELVRRFSDESGELADLEVRARMAGRWRMATVQMSFAIMPALVYLFAGVDIRRVATRSRSARSSPSRRCRRGCCSRSSRCSRSGWKCRPRSPCSGASSSTSTCRSTSSSAPMPRAMADVRGDVSLRDVWFRYDEDAPWTLSEIDAEVPAGTRTALVGETGSGKTTLAYLVARLYEPEQGAVSIDGDRHPRHDTRLARGDRRAGLPGDLPVPCLDPREPALRLSGGQRRADRGCRQGGPDP